MHFFSKILEHFKKIDWILVVIPVFLSVFGIAVQYSLTYENPGINNFIKQIIFLVVGLIIMFIASFYDYRTLILKSNFFYIIILILLTLVLVVGTATHGAKSWFDFGFFKFQPVEFLKIIIVLLLTFYWGNCNRKIISFRDILGSILICIPSFVLVLLQPDFGSFILLFAVMLFFIFTVNAKVSHYILFGIGCVVFVCCFWMFILKPYQKNRILSFLNPLSDQLGSGYQVTQSMIAIGSGGFFGKGLGFGDQSQLNFLPESGNDFVFAAFAEEFGFAGVLILIGLYFILFYKFFIIVKDIEDDAGVFIFIGFGTLLITEIIINIGMGVGVMPVTGISLPFVSYGGSGMISNFIIFGILESVIASQNKF